MIAVSMLYKDMFLNGTQKAFFFNGTIAILDIFNNLLNYEKAPQWFIGGCQPGVYIRNTAYENATAPFKDEVSSSDGSIARFFFNGTVIKLSSTGAIVAVIVPPTSLAQPPADFTVSENTIGEKIILYTNGTRYTYSAPITTSSSSSRIEIAIGYLFKVLRPELNTETIYYRNGSVA